jgi:hypothetical protein
VQALETHSLGCNTDKLLRERMVGPEDPSEDEQAARFNERKKLIRLRARQAELEAQLKQEAEKP